MNLFKKLSLVTLASLALGSGAAFAGPVTEHVHEVMQSGATFDGNITFAENYTSILGVDGYLDGGAYGHDHMSWDWNTYDDQSHEMGIAGKLSDWLMDGVANTNNYIYYLGIAWSAPADQLSIDIGSDILLDYAGVDAYDRVVSVTVGDGSPQSNVPEPASMVLLGLGLAGLAAARRRKA